MIAQTHTHTALAPAAVIPESPSPPAPGHAPARPEPTPLALTLSVLRRMGPASVLAAMAMTLPPLGSIVLFAWMNSIGQWLRTHDALGLLMYLVGFALLTGMALLPTYATAILGGWAFGFALGFPAAMAGFVGGAAIGYLAGRTASGDRGVRLINEHPRWRAVRDALVGRGFWRSVLIVSLLRLPPSSPFAATNLVLSAVRVHPLAYLVGTALGMAPRTGVVLYFADRIRLSVAAEDARSSLGLWWMTPIGIVVTLAVFAVLSKISAAAIARVTRHEPGAERSSSANADVRA